MSPDSLKAYVLWEAYPEKEKEAEIMVARRCAQIHIFEVTAAGIIDYILAMTWTLKAVQMPTTLCLSMLLLLHVINE